MPRCSRVRVGWTWLLGTVRAWAVGPHASVNFCVHCSLSAGTEVTQAFPRQMAKWVDVTTAVQVFGVAIIADGRQHHDSDHPVFLLTARPKGESRIPAERLEVWGSKVLVSETEAEPFPWLSRYQVPGVEAPAPWQAHQPVRNCALPSVLEQTRIRAVKSSRDSAARRWKNGGDLSPPRPLLWPVWFCAFKALISFILE